jgi:N-acetylneuraminic acid mutarotase
MVLVVPMIGDRRAALIVFLVLCSLSISLPNIAAVRAAEDSWTIMEDMPTARSGLGVAVVDGKIYAIGGQNGEGVLNITGEYDPVTNEWTSKTSMPTARSDFGIAVYQNKIYVIGGTTGPGETWGSSLITGATEVYDPETDTWQTKTSMPTPRQGLEANVVTDRIYLIGGVRYVGGYIHPGFDENEVYDPATDSWITKAPLPTAVWGYSSAVVDNKIYLIGGGNKTSDGTFPVTLNQIYTPATNTWNFGQSIPTGLWHAAAGATTDVFAPKRIYVLGGSYYDAAYNLTQTYDPEVDAWTTGTPMPTPRWSLGVAVIDDELYAIGGKTEGDDYSAVNEKYTPIGYIPEFPAWTPLLIMLLAVVAVALIYRRSLHKHDQGRRNQ